MLNDVHFKSVSGFDSSGPLSWIVDHGPRWLFTERDGEQIVSVVGPCGNFQAGVAVTESQVTVDTENMAISAEYCPPPEGDWNRWVHQLIQEPLQYEWDGETLTLTNTLGSLTLKAEDETQTPRS